MKRNGFACPTNIYQILTWLLFTLRSTHIFLILNTLIQRNFDNQLVVLVFHIILVASCLIALFIPTYIEPSDPFLILELAKKKLCEKQKISYTLEINKNQDFCLICCSNIKSSSKHCKSCDRCVDNFDHHCIWLNNCIGQANYRYFIMLLITLFFESIYTISATLVYIVQIFNDQALYDKHPENKTYCIVSLSFLVIDMLILVNVIYLIAVHIYLSCKGLTTYEYIMLRTQKLDEKGAEEKPPNPNQEKESYVEMLKGMGKGRNKVLPLDIISKLESNKYMEENDRIVINDDAPNVFKPLTDLIYNQNKKVTLETLGKEIGQPKIANGHESNL